MFFNIQDDAYKFMLPMCAKYADGTLADKQACYKYRAADMVAQNIGVVTGRTVVLKGPPVMKSEAIS